MVKMFQNPPPPLTSFREIAQIIAKTKYIPSINSLVDEIEYFLKTGDFELKPGKIVCVNPTLLTLGNKLWQVDLIKFTNNLSLFN